MATVLERLEDLEARVARHDALLVRAGDPERPERPPAAAPAAFAPPTPRT